MSDTQHTNGQTDESVSIELTQSQKYIAYLVGKGLLDQAAAVIAQLRADADAELVAAYNNPGAGTRVKSVDVVHQGVHLSSFTVTEPSPTITITDKHALHAHYEKSNPRLLKTEIVLDAAEEKRIKDAKKMGHTADGEVIDPKTGEVIPGLKYIKGAAATGTRIAPMKGEKAEKRDAMLAQLAGDFDLNGIVASTRKALEAKPTVAGTIVHHQGADVDDGASAGAA